MKGAGLLGSTFVLLQPADLLQHRLQVHVEPVAVAQQLQEVAGARRAAGVVDELPRRGKAVGKDLELLPLQQRNVRSDLWGFIKRGRDPGMWI